MYTYIHIIVETIMKLFIVHNKFYILCAICVRQNKLSLMYENGKGNFFI